ncbi:MAG: arsenic efflux protein [Candidatus Marinimicrobia bacterium]|nr:arsenic efflux protein [Candidatus Neomarinimicrobiota bacterium]
MLLKSFNHALMITSFVFVMMLIIEYINIQTQGVWHESIQKSRWKQYFIGAFLGIIPGCLGAFTAVALFSHGIISFGAVVAAMIATSGDETFVMLAMIPETAILIAGLLFIIGIIVGALSDKFLSVGTGEREFEIHQEEMCNCFPTDEISDQLKNLTLQRGVLILLTLLLLFGIIFGKLGPQIWDWKRITFLILSSISLFIVVTVPEHFLEEHLWEHVIKKHVPYIFTWTFGALLFLNFLSAHLNLKQIIDTNQYLVLLVATLVGLIPQSGPHLIFVTFFAEGMLPFPILLASSIVQDGHGMLPMLAESRKNFIHIKLINLAVGIIIGGAGLIIQHLF